jgi:hypothetical protein
MKGTLKSFRVTQLFSAPNQQASNGQAVIGNQNIKNILCHYVDEQGRN